METLIELYDERPFENILATEIFHPKRTVFICPEKNDRKKSVEKNIAAYFEHRKLDTEIIFLNSSMYDAVAIARQLEIILEHYTDCVLNVTGGTDAALFAGGMVCEKYDIPAFTYARKSNRFYNINKAEFVNYYPCDIVFSIEDFIIMAGGTIREGRVSDSFLAKHKDTFQPFFSLYLKHKPNWAQYISYIQKISQNAVSGSSLKASSKKQITDEHGTVLKADIDFFHSLENIGYIYNFKNDNETVSFSFQDSQTRFWLRDIGSVLELFVYRQCLESNFFQDVKSSVIVDWEGTEEPGNVVNEIDVVAVNGCTPLFISCKTCDIKTEALNELSILRDRFGGKMSKAAIVTTEYVNAVTRHRASELNIAVIDHDDLENGSLQDALQSIIRM